MSYIDINAKRNSLEGLEECLQRTGAVIDKVQSTARQTPRVNENGFSDCPFAGEVHAQAAKAEQEGRHHLDRLNTYMKVLAPAIEEVKRELNIISAKHDSLNGDSARGHFTAAEDALARRYKHYLSLRDGLLRATQALRVALQEAATKIFMSGGHNLGPVVKAPTPPVFFERTTDWKAPSSGVRRELDDLFALDSGRPYGERL